MMKIEHATPIDICFVARQMRERDFAEFSALSAVTTREELVNVLVARLANHKHTLCASTEAGPVAIGAAIEARPKVLSLLFFATDEFPVIADQLTRFIKQRLFPPLVAAGIHRIETVSLDGYTQARRWLGVLGLEPETRPLLNYGKNGEAFVQFSWVKDVRPPSP